MVESSYSQSRHPKVCFDPPPQREDFRARAKSISNSLCHGQASFLTTIEGTKGYTESGLSIQHGVASEQERTYMQISFYKGELATSILSSWIGDICASITQDCGIYPVIGGIACWAIWERTDP